MPSPYRYFYTLSFDREPMGGNITAEDGTRILVNKKLDPNVITIALGDLPDPDHTALRGQNALGIRNMDLQANNGIERYEFLDA